MQGSELMAWRTPPGLWARLKPVARRMRQQPTPAETALWQELRGGRLRGFTFRRQHPLGRFVVDFYCRETGLVIEVDGPIHKVQPAADAARQSQLEDLGLRVLRFSNDAVLHARTGVMEAIDSALRDPGNLGNGNSR